MTQPKRVNSLIRGLEILESFAPGDMPLSLQELSVRTALPKTTVHRFLKTLLALKYVTLDSRTKAYSLAPRVMALGFSVLAGLGLRDTAYPYLQALSRETDQNVNLAVLDRTDVLFIERIMVRRIINTNLFVGSRLNCYRTAAGRAIIAFLSQDRYDELLSALLGDREAVGFIGRRGETLGAILGKTRDRGFAMNNEEWVPGLRAIGCPVFNDRGEVEASVNMSFISQQVSLEEMVGRYLPKLQETAERISSLRGCGGSIRYGR